MVKIEPIREETLLLIDGVSPLFGKGLWEISISEQPINNYLLLKRDVCLKMLKG